MVFRENPFSKFGRFTPEHGSRFTQKSRNTARIIFMWGDLEEFSKKHAPAIYFYFKHPNIVIIKEELLSLSFIWYSLVYPLWQLLGLSSIEQAANYIKGIFQKLFQF